MFSVEERITKKKATISSFAEGIDMDDIAFEHLADMLTGLASPELIEYALREVWGVGWAAGYADGYVHR